MMIKEFRGEFSFLSNFAKCPNGVTMNDGIKYPTSEHAYQAAKTKERDIRQQISKLSSPSEAKAFGKKIKLRYNWNKIRIEEMRKILINKFKQDPYLLTSLLKTENEELCEGNNWNDTFWGIDLKTGKGENNLGKLLMEIREMFSKEVKDIQPMRK